jgi:hypothetical protein
MNALVSTIDIRPQEVNYDSREENHPFGLFYIELRRFMIDLLK